MGHLHDKMKRDLILANFAPSTITNYLLYGKRFAKHFMRSPAEMGAEEVKTYLLHCLEVEHCGASVFRQRVAALKFLYRFTLKRPLELEALPYPRQASRLPVVLSGSEVETLFEATTDLKYRTIFMTLYAGGMRVGEVCRLEFSDIDARRGLIRIRQGKGRKDRYVPLSPRLLQVLRDYYRACRPKGPALFPGRLSADHVHSDSIRQALRKAALDAGLCKDVTPHMLRHTYATHMLESGVDATVVQKVLGHAALKTTQIYLQVTLRHLTLTGSPLDLLGTPDGDVLG